MSKVLKTAIEANDPEAVRKALKGVKDVNRKLPNAQSPLLYASEKGADRVLEALFEAGAIAEKRNTFPGDTPFAVAAEHHQFGVMKRLLALKQASDHAIDFVLKSACHEGKAEVLEFMLQQVKPPVTIELFRLASGRSNAPALLKMLVENGGDLDARHETSDAREMTPLHGLADSRKVEVMRTLVDWGAAVNARDSVGRTPLMILATSLDEIETDNEHAMIRQRFLTSGKSTPPDGEPPRILNGLDVVKTLLTLGADATLVDNSGNDALDYYQFKYWRRNAPPVAEIVNAFREAGAQGNPATLEMFAALKKEDAAGVRAAIAKGADVNRLTPPPVPFTPLIFAAGGRSAAAPDLVRVLLEAGADPGKPGCNTTPLIQAARSGNLAVVKELVAAGADIHKVCERGDYIESAYSAAYGKSEVKDYLKSLGAGTPKRTEPEPLKPGVESWNDFSELLAKTSADKAAEALAKIINGKVRLDVYGQSLAPGKQAYVVLRPNGMEWCNIFQIAPPPLRFEDSKKTEALAADLAKSCGAPVLAIEYSDTSDAASIVRIEPDGKKTEDQGWDRDTLEEMVEAMGEEAPAWARKQLARTGEDEPSSTERLEMLAEQEKFVVAAFGFYCEPGRKVEVEVTGYGSEDFDGIAFVSN